MKTELSIAFVGVSDQHYYEHIAKYCLPSWETLPGDKFLITDLLDVREHFFKIVNLDKILNLESNFIKNFQSSKKVYNFWKKMQSQCWAIKNLKTYDWVVLLDTDVENINFDEKMFDEHLEKIKENNQLWGIGFKRNLFNDSIDSGVIIVNMLHPDVDVAFDEYETFWNQGKIYDLKKAYDGNVMVEMLKKYTATYILTTGYGHGRFLYDVGIMHWGGKEPKEFRKSLIDSKTYVSKLLNVDSIKDDE